MRTLGRSETSNSSCPALPALIRAPMSVLRAVTMPSNGATMLLKDSVASNRFTLAVAASIVAFIAAELPFLSSAVCFDTHCNFTKAFQRSAVTAASCALAVAVATFRRKKLFFDDRATDLGARTRRQIAAGTV